MSGFGKRLPLTIIVCLLGYLTARGQENEEEARKIAEAAIRVGAIDYLTDRDFKLDGEQIVATARAIDPKEHLQVELRKFSLLPGRADLKFRLLARFRFEGKITIDDVTRDCRGEADIGQLVTIEAKYWVDSDGLHVDARATDIKFSVKIHEITPDDIAGGREAAGKIAVQQLRRQKDELLRQFNEWQAEYQRKML
jgi:hypothetical protein